MDYRNYQSEIESLFEEHGTVTATAKQFAKNHGLVYDDTVRRGIGKRLKKKREQAPHRQTTQSRWEENFDKETAYYEGVVPLKIKTLEEALAVAQADMNVWEVEKWLCNSWGVTSWKSGKQETATNYQVKVWFKRKVKEYTLEDAMGDALGQARTWKISSSPLPDSGVGVFSLTDFHIGADVRDLLRTEDFDLRVLVNRLDHIARYINGKKYSSVHLIMLGDYFESISGLNHPNTFKSLGKNMWGANTIIVAYEVVAQFMSSIHNLEKVYMVSGNHDRMTADSKVDNTGEGGKLLHFMLQNKFPDLPIMYHNSVISKPIDGINYVLSHGDKGYSKKDMSKMILDYGDQDLFNLYLEGHLHSRVSTKVFSTERKIWNEVEVVCRDEVNYRKIVCPPLFTGNWFSESLGYSSASGFLEITNNGRGKPIITDVSL